MKDLIERLEKATEGSDALDAAIHRAVTGEVVIEGPPFNMPVVMRGGNPVAIPRRSRSLDAALTLVPEGYFVTLATRKDAPPEAFVWWANDTRSEYGQAPSLPLALCIAALKARSEA